MSGAEMSGAERAEAKITGVERAEAGLSGPGAVTEGAAAGAPEAGGHGPSGGGASLERRYRRLLSVYPRGHRAEHAEEMLGVLMAGTQEGQTRPGTRESANLLAGAARIRLRHAGRAFGGTRWRDALAVVSVLAPMLMLTLLLEIISPLGLTYFLHSGRIFRFPLAWWAGAVPGQLLVLAGWAAVTAFVLLRMRRAATVASAAAFTVQVLLFAITVHGVGGLIGSPHEPVEMFLGTLTLAALPASAGPRRGLEILGRRRTTLIVAGLLAWAAAHQAAEAMVGDVWFHSPAGFVLIRCASLAAMAVLVPVAVMCARNPIGGRVALLASPAVTPYGVAYLLTAATSIGSYITRVVVIPGTGRRMIIVVHHSVVQPVAVMWVLYLALAIVVVALALGGRRARRRPAPVPA